jgi:hypothetical protein
MGQSLRAKLGLNKPAKPATPPQEAVPAKPGKLAAVEVPGRQVITYLCGHRTGAANVRNQPCPACARKGRAAARARREEAGRGRGPDRLPDGSAFLLVYDDSAVAWSGTLTVGALCFEAKASGVAKLLGMLDAMYRDMSTRACDQK